MSTQQNLDQFAPLKLEKWRVTLETLKLGKRRVTLKVQMHVGMRRVALELVTWTQWNLDH